MEYIINDKHIISDREKVEKRFYSMGIYNVNLDRISEFVNSESNTIFYFDTLLNLKENTDKKIFFAWIDSGYRYMGETVFIALKKVEDYFDGFYVGSAKFLVNGLCEKTPYKHMEYKTNLSKFLTKYLKKIEKRSNRYIDEDVSDLKTEEKEDTMIHSEMQKALERCGIERTKFPENTSEITKETTVFQSEATDVTEEIFNHLLFPSWKSIDGLDRYIKIIGKRIEQLVSKGATEYYVKNHLGSVIVNSGLMNLFGQDYLIHYRINEKYKTYIAHQVISGKKDYLDNGFSKEQTAIELKPIQFFDEGEELFSPIMDDFDLNQHSLVHIIEERRNRFPKNLQDMDANKIASHLMSALERGLKMQERDRFFVKASYSGKDGKISWIMPLHINEKLTDEPELVMVIRKVKEFYEVKTILPYSDEMKDRIIALSLYSKSW